MKYADQKTAIETKFMLGWDSVATPVKFDNMIGLLKGTGKLDNEKGLKEWVMIRINDQSASPAAINIKMIRYTGSVMITVFTETTKGDKRARVLADKVTEVMDAKPEDWIVYYPGQIVFSGPTPDGTLFMVTVEVPFQSDLYR